MHWTVASTSALEKYWSCRVSIFDDLTLRPGVDCAFFTICAQAHRMASGSGLRPAV
jgi:hypothetical protein